MQDKFDADLMPETAFGITQTEAILHFLLLLMEWLCLGRNLGSNNGIMCPERLIVVLTASAMVIRKDFVCDT